MGVAAAVVMNPYVGPAALASLILSALRLEESAFRRVAGDPRSLHHCLAASILGAIGLGLLQSQHLPIAANLLVLVSIAFAAVQLLAETAIVRFLGGRVLGTWRGFGEMLRPLALARAPGILFLLAALPEGVGPRTALARGVELWLVVAFVVAIRVALGCSWRAAVLLALGVWLVEHVPDVLLGWLEPGSPAGTVSAVSATDPGASLGVV